MMDYLVPSMVDLDVGASHIPLEMDWTDWLPSGGALDSASWTAETGITIDSSSVTSPKAGVVISLSGAESLVGKRLWLKCVGVSGAASEPRTLLVNVVKK